MAFIVLAVADDSLSGALHDHLGRQGHALAEVSPEAALPRALAQLEPDLTIADVDGNVVPPPELVQAIREITGHPMIAMTVERDAHAVSALLHAGADDVIPPDAALEIVSARATALIRRYQASIATPAPQPTIATGELVIDRQRRELRRRGEVIDLTTTEYHLLDILAERAGQTVAAGVLAERLWSGASEQHSHRLRTYIGYLRRKIGDSSRRPEYIVTEWGYGYRLALHPFTSQSPADRGDVPAGTPLRLVPGTGR